LEEIRAITHRQVAHEIIWPHISKPSCASKELALLCKIRNLQSFPPLKLNAVLSGLYNTIKKVL
jgi:hypothetical protein